MPDNAIVASTKVITGGEVMPAKSEVKAESGGRPAWVSNARDSETVIGAAENDAVRDDNMWGLKRLFAGRDVDELCGALAQVLAKDSVWEKIKRSFSSKVSAVRISDEIALYPPDRRYLGYEGYEGFAYIREGASYSTLVRIPEEMLADPGLLARVKAGVAKAAADFRRTGEVDVVRDFRSAVAT